MNIRPWDPDDIPALTRINQAATPAVNSLTEAELARLLSQSHATLVAEDAHGIGGFVLCLREGLGYDSLNYEWFSARYPTFAYIDRVIVNGSHRGQGIGERLYNQLITQITPSAPVLLCEVNERPPNPGSLKFHGRLGFAEVGRQDTEGGAKRVVMMEKRLGEML